MSGVSRVSVLAMGLLGLGVYGAAAPPGYGSTASRTPIMPRRSPSGRGSGAVGVHAMKPLLALSVLILFAFGCARRAPAPGVIVAGAEGQGLQCVLPKRMSFGPIAWPAELAGERHGAGWKSYAEAQTSLAQPVEVCGVAEQYRFLGSLTCATTADDGALVSPSRVVRVGNVGGGGRCGRIVDLYRVSCPEGVHEVFVDLYHCVPGEDFSPK